MGCHRFITWCRICFHSGGEKYTLEKMWSRTLSNTTLARKANLLLASVSGIHLNWLDTITIFQAQMFPKLLQAARRDIKQKDGHKVRLLNRCLLVAPRRFGCQNHSPGLFSLPTVIFYLHRILPCYVIPYTCGLNKDYCLKLSVNYYAF